jgi:hypothetical protein
MTENLASQRKEKLRVQLTLLDTFISEIKAQLKLGKDKVKSCQSNFIE